MLQKQLIENFLAQPIIAVVGVSRSGDDPANHIFRKFRELHYAVYPVNPKAEEVEGEPCYADLFSLPIAPSAVVLSSTPEVSLQTIKDCIALKISAIWLHRGIGNGSYSKEAVQLAKSHDIEVIENGCPMMFLGKVDIFHRALRWLKS